MGRVRYFGSTFCDRTYLGRPRVPSFCCYRRVSFVLPWSSSDCLAISGFVFLRAALVRVLPCKDCAHGRNIELVLCRVSEFAHRPKHSRNRDWLCTAPMLLLRRTSGRKRHESGGHILTPGRYGIGAAPASALAAGVDVDRESCTLCLIQSRGLLPPPLHMSLRDVFGLGPSMSPSSISL